MDKLVTIRLVERLKNSDFILEKKMEELNQNQNSKQPNWPDAMWKLYFTLGINEQHISTTYEQHITTHNNNISFLFYRIVFLKVQENFWESSQIRELS